MNTRAYMFEGLVFEEADSQVKKNSVSKFIREFYEQMRKRFAIAEMIRRERVQLSCMSDRQLADIGITQFEAYREVNRSISDLAGIYR